MLRAALFKSKERFASFKDTIEKSGVDCIVLDFETQEWIEFDYSKVNFVIYYPSFKYSSNHPLALSDVYDNLIHINSSYPEILMYPDPKIIRLYNDKYRQYLFLKKSGFPIPLTVPLLSEGMLEIAERDLGYPMVVKNRYGAGGDSVFKINNRNQLKKYYDLSVLNVFNRRSARHFFGMVTRRIFLYHLIKAKRMVYPFLSPPLLAQKYIHTDRDLKTVVGNYKVVEGHWRFQANEKQWKVNIDGGGIGEWSFVPDKALEISEKLARSLDAHWLNIDLIPKDEEFLITEFSPVWHHYKYKEKPSFVYKDDYNIETPLETSLNLEKIIVESLIGAVKG